MEKSEHFELRAWLATSLLLSLHLPTFTTDGQILAEVKNSVIINNISHDYNITVVFYLLV